MPDPTDTRTCTACGTQLPGDAAFCHSCGTQQPETVAQTPEQIAAQEAELEAALRAALEPQYQLVRRLGRGGMGSVYLARDPELKRSVAVKVLAPELAVDETARTRFQREAQAVAALSHPHVVAIHSVGVLETGAPYFVMQHVEGGNLEQRLEEEGPLEVAEAKRVIGQVASALEAAHAKGIIHRDVKPSNVLHDPESDRVLVSDFGIAAVRPGSTMTGPTQLTQTGALVGTPRYMSPEQLLSEAVTEKTDIYGLGLLAYELVTAESPFQGKSPQMIAAAHLKDAPPDLAEAREDADPELREVVRACLAKEPEERPRAAELARRLHPGAGGLLEWPPPGLEGLRGRVRRPAVVLLVGSAAMLVPSLIGVASGVFATTGWSSFAQTLGLAVALVGIVMVVTALVRLGAGLRDLRRGIAQGHAWGTAVEVMADARGDTGAVMTGSREYAGLTPEERGRLRRARVIRAGALLLAAVLPLPMFVFMAQLAAAGAVGPDGAWTIPVIPSLALLAVAGTLAWREQRRVAGARASANRRGRATKALGRLIPSWYERFGEVIGTAQPGAGPDGRPGMAHALAGLVVVLVAGGALVGLPVTAVTTSGGAILQIQVPNFGRTQDRIQEVGYGRRYRLRPTPDLSAVEAGAILAAMAPPRTGPGDRIAGAIRVPADTLRAPVYPPACDRAFGGNYVEATASLFEQAYAGLDQDQLACLRAVDRLPEIGRLSALARAPELDYWGATLALPLPPDLSPHELPVPVFRRMRELLYAAVGKAALASTEGRTDQAELLLREIVSVGFLMIDDGRTLLTGLIGAVTAGIGLQHLEDHYRLSGQVDAARRLNTVRDSARSVSEALGVVEEQMGSSWQSSDPVTLREVTLATAMDSTAIPGLRWEMLRLMAVLPCTNTRELLFGPAPGLRAAWDRARNDLVRTPTDSALFAAFEETLPRLARHPAPYPLLGGVRWIGRFLGSEQLQGCAAVIGL